jgi:hypothetical protein
MTKQINTTEAKTGNEYTHPRRRNLDQENITTWQQIKAEAYTCRMYLGSGIAQLEKLLQAHKLRRKVIKHTHLCSPNSPRYQVHRSNLSPCFKTQLEKDMYLEKQFRNIDADLFLSREPPYSSEDEDYISPHQYSDSDEEEPKSKPPVRRKLFSATHQDPEEDSDSVTSHHSTHKDLGTETEAYSEKTKSPIQKSPSPHIIHHTPIKTADEKPEPASYTESDGSSEEWIYEKAKPEADSLIPKECKEDYIHVASPKTASRSSSPTALTTTNIEKLQTSTPDHKSSHKMAKDELQMHNVHHQKIQMPFL